MSESKEVRDICKALFEPAELRRNDMFQRGRMAYIVELEEEQQNDVPVTLLRSTAESTSDRAEQNINANNMLINASSKSSSSFHLFVAEAD